MKAKGVLVNLLVLVGSLLVLFVVLEVFCRLFLPRPKSVFVENVRQSPIVKSDQREEGWGRGVGGPALFEGTAAGLRLRRNVNVRIEWHNMTQQDIFIKTNALGYRGDDVPPKTPNDFRILALGDSITLADYVPEEATFPSQLEQILKKTKTSKNLDVVNSGTSSIDLRSELMILLETGLTVEPDVILVGLYLNDADTSFTVNAVSYPRGVRWSHLLMHVLNRENYLMTLLRYRQREEDRRDALEQFLGQNPAAETATSPAKRSRASTSTTCGGATRGRWRGSSITTAWTSSRWPRFRHSLASGCASRAGPRIRATW